MSNLADIGDLDAWRCWVCDEPVDRHKSVNDARGPSVDSRSTSPKGKSTGSRRDVDTGERLAHRGCNTRKGAVKAVISWPASLLVLDPAPLLGVAERLERKGGREVVARCPGRSDADEVSSWLVDRFSRLVPGLQVHTSVEAAGGQFVVALVRSS
jgi:hypothetical protein